MPLRKLDDIDKRILQQLQDNARISNVDLANRVGLSPAPCLRRVRDLERTHVIRKHVTLLDPATLGLDVTVFAQISIDLRLESRLQAFEKTVLQRPEIVECYLVAGDAGYLLRIVVADVPSYERFLKEVLSRIESVTGIRVMFVLREVKHSTALSMEPYQPPQEPSFAVPGLAQASNRSGRRRAFR